MKLAVLSDGRLPTRKDFPGHGLGQIMLAIAEGLKARGHEVQLFAGAGSEFSGGLATRQDEREFLSIDEAVAVEIGLVRCGAGRRPFP